MIYSASGSVSGSDFRKVSMPASVPAPVPTPVPAPVPVPDPDNIKQFFNNKEMCTKACLFYDRISIISQKVGLLFFIFYFFIPLYVGSAYRPRSEIGTRTGCIPAPVPQRQKVKVPAVSVPQH